MRKGERPLTSLNRTFNPSGEGFHLQGVIGIVALDPEMAFGLEIEIETIDPGTTEINHRIHLPAQILKTEGLTVTVLLTRLQQGSAGVAQSLQLPVEIAAEGVDQQRAQIGGRTVACEIILVEAGQAQGAVT